LYQKIDTGELCSAVKIIKKVNLKIAALFDFEKDEMLLF